MSSEQSGEAVTPSLDERFDALRHEFALQADEGPDHYMRAFYKRIWEEVNTSEVLSSSIHNMLDLRPEITSGYAANIVLRAIQAIELSHDPTYPQGKDKPRGWDTAFSRIEEDGEIATTFWVNLTRGVASNIANRGKLLKVASLLHEKKDGLSILDIGCSQNHILKKLALAGKRGLGYPQTVVMRRETADSSSHKVVRDSAATVSLNKLIQTRLNIGPSVGVDLWSPNDPQVREWARSCSFYPGHLLVPRLTREYNKLTQASPPEVKFYGRDFAKDFDAADLARRHPSLPKQFDVTYFSTVLYQTTAEERQAMLNNAYLMTKPNGLIIIQDFIDTITPDGNMQFHDNWTPYTYSLWVMRMKKPELGFQKYLSVENGRAQRAILEPALGELATARRLKLKP